MFSRCILQSVRRLGGTGTRLCSEQTWVNPRLPTKTDRMGEFHLNSVNLIGRLARDPELRNDDKMLVFVVATNEYRPKLHTEVDEKAFNQYTFFHRVIVFGSNLDRMAGNFNKGDKVFVSGRLSYDSPTPNIKNVTTIADKVMTLQRKRIDVDNRQSEDTDET